MLRGHPSPNPLVSLWYWEEARVTVWNYLPKAFAWIWVFQHQWWWQSRQAKNCWTAGCKWAEEQVSNTPFSQETCESKAKAQEQCKREGERAIEERQRLFAGWKEWYQKSPYESELVQSVSGVSSTSLALQILFSMLNKTFSTNSPIAAPPVVTSGSGSWLEGPRLLEMEPVCCRKYSPLFLHQELPWILPS